MRSAIPTSPTTSRSGGLRLPICQGLDQYANVRPTRILPGITSPLRDVGPGDLDWVIVRENSEGEYAGHGGRAHRGLPEEVATETAIFTRRGVERIMRFAFDIARSRPRKLLTVVTKSNAQRHGMVFWDEIAALVSHDYPDVTWDKELVDAMTMRMVRKPQTIDTVVATNLHADILSDLAAALAGSLGIAPTGNVDPERRSPSMFEPIHGSAFDITGKGIANPVASFWTGAMMLEHLGEKPAAELLMRAVEQVCAAGIMTPDLGGKADHSRSDPRGVRGGTRHEPLMDEAFTAEESNLLEQARALVPVLAERATATNVARDVRAGDDRRLPPHRHPAHHPAAPLRRTCSCASRCSPASSRPLPRAAPPPAGSTPYSANISGCSRRIPLQAQIDVWGDDPQARRIVLARATCHRRTHRRRLAI